MDVHQGIAVITASLGGIDKPTEHAPQSVLHDYYSFTDDNFPPRKGLTPRLQSKIPKCFAWELRPDYEFYLWIDGSLTLTSPHAIKYFYDQIQDHDIVVLRHPDRPNIRQEVRYTRKGINQKSIYVLSRYTGEFLQEMYDVVQADKEYVDDLLVIGGIFMYRNTPKVHQMLKEWWYYQTRYIVQDQIPFPYVLKNSGVKIKILDDTFKESWYLKHGRHKQRDK